MVIGSDSKGRKWWSEIGRIISYRLSIVIDNSKNYRYPTSGYKVYRYDTSDKKTILSMDGIYMTSSNEYLLEDGKSFEIESLDRAEKMEFTSQKNTQYVFNNGMKYLIKSNTEITITPREGILVKFSIDSESGSGGSPVIISKASTKGGTYFSDWSGKRR